MACEVFALLATLIGLTNAADLTLMILGWRG
jgi:hypothetical protein